MMTSDLALIGRLGDQAVAAAALAHTVLFMLFVLGMGSSRRSRRSPRKLTARASRAWCAARCASDCGRRSSSACRSRWCSFGAASFCSALGQSPRSAALAGRYLDRHRAGASSRLVLHRAAQFHGRGEPPGAGTVDHARRDPGQRAARLCADLWRVRAAARSTCSAPALRPPWSASACASRRSGSATRAGRSANIACSAAAGGPIGRCCAKLSSSARRSPARFLLEYGVFAAAAQLMGWIGTQRARRASDRAADRRDHVHGAVRHRHGGDRARRPCGRARRCGRDAARRLLGDRARRRVHGGDDAARRR